MFNFTPVVKNLLILNVGIYIIQRMLPEATYYLGLFPIGTENFIPTQLFTNIFAHSPATWRHLIYNMISLIVFGPMLERTIGDKKFLLLFMISGICATLLHVAYFELYLHQPYFLLGASGAVMGVTVACALYYPNMELMIYFLFPIKLKYLAILFIAMDVMNGFSGSSDGIAHFAHLGGAAAGLIMVLIWKGSNTNRY